MNPSLQAVVDTLNRIMVGKQDETRLALICLLARGHLLMEDLPGMGKTTLAQTLARVLGLQFNRIQFTSDLLPADILGTSIFDRNEQRFSFHAGPVFTQVLVADEVNRATPKTQSALLEAMAEQQVTVDGQTRALPQPFFVIATQNPQHQIGTYPLPESQLDRFLMRLRLGYPDARAERSLLKEGERHDMVMNLAAQAAPDQLLRWQQAVGQVSVSDALLDYVQALLNATRTRSEFVHGLSPRAGLALLRAARAAAFAADRKFVLPDDVQLVFAAVAAHRLSLRDARQDDSEQAARRLLRDVPVPV